ncbi:LYR motif-containing protein 2 isoform X2 [Lutra lutra]|uniref:LYR motif-containing protein 2 isoform X2 n=1 Tax=Lutra lutra TaxID=9657 RepID=UPI001FD16BFE|nr:LYR motif-containing protein 2 isoform X2 [Lutra lutra]
MFMRRQQVLLLYRRILQAIREVPNDSDRKYLKDWAREEFKRNKSATEEVRTRSWSAEGNDEMKAALHGAVQQESLQENHTALTVAEEQDKLTDMNISWRGHDIDSVRVVDW